MVDTNIKKLHTYYRKTAILPTHACFSSIADLNRYELFRTNFFVDKLKLPLVIFRDLKMVEFGPDTGENSLVFARWGASLTLVEPNPHTWPYIRSYFKKFNLKGSLDNLIKADLESFKTNKRFQFIDAEGFVYTIRPMSLWINVFKRIITDKGLFVISYCESTGALLELLLKMIYVRLKELTDLPSRDIARKLYQTKWDSINHTRSFESWQMDVLDNPFVRLKYFFDAESLCRELAKKGFWLYSSWPNYRDTLDVYWHKKELSKQVQLANNCDFIRRCCLSFAFGRKLFMGAGSHRIIHEAHEVTTGLTTLVDRSIDGYKYFKATEATQYLKVLKDILSKDFIVSGSSKDVQETLSLLDSFEKIFKLLDGGGIDSIITFCNSDWPFINSWGMPAHFAVFQKCK